MTQPTVIKVTEAGTPTVIKVLVPGLPGQKGDPGTPGAPGAPGTGGMGVTYTVATPSAVWTIPHGMGTLPTAIVRDSTGEVRIVDIQYPDLNTIQVTWAAPTSGTVELR